MLSTASVCIGTSLSCSFTNVIGHGRSTGDESRGFNRDCQRFDGKIGDVNNSDG